jgi:leader peptidase (prepilin peptidase)/N-methyltransferase
MHIDLIAIVPAWAVLLFVFALGGCIGSFLNVCIWRMPREESIVRPRSRCPHCTKPIAWFDNVPVVSYLRLRGRCRSCKKPIHWRYPLVELLTACSLALVVWRFGLTPEALVYGALVCALITVSFIDFDFQIIPDEISLGGLVVGVLASVLIPSLHGTDNRLAALGQSVIGLLAGGGILYVTGVLGDFVFRKETMGGGDVKLLAMAGTVLGWKLVVLTFFLAPVLALLPGIYVLLFRRSHVIPYGPFLSLALVVSLFYGAQIIRATGIEETIHILREYS